jgi:hypothetical protein
MSGKDGLRFVDRTDEATGRNAPEEKKVDLKQTVWG